MSREADLLTEMGCNAGTLNASTCAEWYARQAEAAQQAEMWARVWSEAQPFVLAFAGFVALVFV
jgi:hypothetical protein